MRTLQDQDFRTNVIQSKCWLFVFLIAIVFRTQAEALEEAEKNPDEDKIEPWMPAPKPGGGAGK